MTEVVIAQLPRRLRAKEKVKKNEFLETRVGLSG